jgi:hypothetical protein
MASSGILISLMQPVLRGALREVRLEGLTQAERNLLYSIRDFMRFRRQFYVNIVGSDGYLGLLALAQAIRNQEVNLVALERNLLEHEELARRDLIAAIQVDQVLQQVQQGRLSLLAVQQGLVAALDRFKLQLGLPPDFEVELDDQALKPFELQNPRLDELRERNERLRLSLIQFEETPPVDVVKKGYHDLEDERQELAELYDEVTADWRRWDERLKQEQKSQLTEAERQQLERERELADRLKLILKETGADFQEDDEAIAKGMQANRSSKLAKLWSTLDDLVAERFREQLANLLVAQNQIRVYSIQIEPVRIEPEVAIALARR